MPDENRNILFGKGTARAFYVKGYKRRRNGNVSFLAPAGDLGCSGGPFLVGMVSDAAGGSLNKGIAAATVFPLLMLAGIMLCKHTEKKS